jgi:hypothetical protein
MLVNDDEADDAANAERSESDVWIQHLDVGDNNATSGAADANNGVLEIVGVHWIIWLPNPYFRFRILLHTK